MDRDTRPQGVRRRFVVIQVDGLSHREFERAIERGAMPATSRLLRRGAVRAHRLRTGIPTSTPAFQAALMYGGPVDVPAFEYLDKRTLEYRWFIEPWTSARVDEEHARGRRGILEGGRAYGCVLSGGATDSVLTFARLLSWSSGWRHFGLRAMAAPLMALAVSVARAAFRTGAHVIRRLWPRRGPSGAGAAHHKAIASYWRQVLRECFMLGVLADLQAGIPAVYANFVGYDVAAHALGPDHPDAYRELRPIDRAIGVIARAARRAPGDPYDLFVLSDHGQVRSVPFSAVSGDVPLGTAVFEALRVEPKPSLAESLGRKRGIWADHLCVVPAGPNINIYLTDTPEHVGEEELERRHPGGLERLSRHPGIGLVLARGAQGLVCYYRGDAYRPPFGRDRTGCPLFDRPDRELIVRELEELLAMPSAGDIIVYGHYTAQGCVSYLGERGSHAGPSEEELYGFLLTPAELPIDGEQISGPRDLYELLIGYRERDGLPVAAGEQSEAALGARVGSASE